MTLDDLAIKYKTDKSSLHHGYAAIYEKHFRPLQHENIAFVECGIGGYEHEDRGGESLRMWREWFSRAFICGVDIHKKSFEVPGVSLLYLSQDSAALPLAVKGATVFIDDASHINPLTLKTFEIVFPVIAPGGFYVIEDIETSYCSAIGWAEGCPDIADYNAPTAINLGRWLLNDLNAKYNGVKEGLPIKALYFYPNLIIIEKQ